VVFKSLKGIYTLKWAIMIQATSTHKHSKNLTISASHMIKLSN